MDLTFCRQWYVCVLVLVFPEQDTAYDFPTVRVCLWNTTGCDEDSEKSWYSADCAAYAEGEATFEDEQQVNVSIAVSSIYLFLT